MRSIDSEFYHSLEWKRVRTAYKERHPLCEICYAKGKISPAEHIHHKVWLNKDNVNNPKISLSFDNLQAVCHECHNKIHFGSIVKRYTVDASGQIKSNDSPLS